MQELEAKTLRTPPLAVRIISAYEAGEIQTTGTRIVNEWTVECILE